MKNKKKMRKERIKKEENDERRKCEGRKNKKKE